MVTISISVFTILVSWGGIWFASYFKKKGANYATKEDIKELTRIQEDIKGEINTLVLNKRSITEQRRKVIIDFYNQYYIIRGKLFYENSFSYFTTSLPFSAYGSYVENLNSELNKLMVCLSSIDLFFGKENELNENINIRSIAYSMYITVLNLNGSIENLITIKLKSLYQKFGGNINTNEGNELLDDDILELKSEILNEIEKVADKAFDDCDEFNELAKSILFYESK